MTQLRLPFDKPTLAQRIEAIMARVQGVRRASDRGATFDERAYRNATEKAKA